MADSFCLICETVVFYTVYYMFTPANCFADINKEKCLRGLKWQNKFQLLSFFILCEYSWKCYQSGTFFRDLKSVTRSSFLKFDEIM